MAIDTFNWCVRIGASEQITKSVYQAKFGDGYEQIAENGINNAAQSWSLSCNGKLEDMSQVRAFLKQHVTKSFLWTNPWGEKNLYRVKFDSINPTFPKKGFCDIAFTFEQAFGP